MNNETRVKIQNDPRFIAGLKMMEKVKERKLTPQEINDQFDMFMLAMAANDFEKSFIPFIFEKNNSIVDFEKNTSLSLTYLQAEIFKRDHAIKEFGDDMKELVCDSVGVLANKIKELEKENHRLRELFEMVCGKMMKEKENG